MEIEVILHACECIQILYAVLTIAIYIYRANHTEAHIIYIHIWHNIIWRFLIHAYSFIPNCSIIKCDMYMLFTSHASIWSVTCIAIAQQSSSG